LTEPERRTVSFGLTPRERRWLDVVLFLTAVALTFVVLGYLANLLASFGDLILVFFLAWLLAFILTPLVVRVATIPFLSRGGAVFIVYILLFGGLVTLAVGIAGALTSSIADFIASVPTLRHDLPNIVAPWQERLTGFGFDIDLTAQATAFLDNLNRYAAQLAGPLQQIAVASLGALANLLLIVVLSLYMVADRDRLLASAFRLVPPQYKEEAALLERSVARSFGGFLRGQAILGIVYAAVAMIASAVFGLTYLAGTTAASGLLMAIPFFGPFLAWAPPVLVALFTKPDATAGTLVVMAAGWLVVMNVLQPRLMAEALRIHPIIVLGSVLIGGKIAGISGAIFGIPIAAVLSALFLHALGRNVDNSPVTARAARRLERRQGHPVRMPREPDPATDADVDSEEDSALPPERPAADPSA
jgi:predicted PurR-regulated permease PerM